MYGKTLQDVHFSFAYAIFEVGFPTSVLAVLPYSIRCAPLHTSFTQKYYFNSSMTWLSSLHLPSIPNATVFFSFPFLSFQAESHSPRPNLAS
jgi:hypothetical protein